MSTALVFISGVPESRPSWADRVESGEEDDIADWKPYRGLAPPSVKEAAVEFNNAVYEGSRSMLEIQRRLRRDCEAIIKDLNNGKLRASRVDLSTYNDLVRAHGEVHQRYAALIRVGVRVLVATDLYEPLRSKRPDDSRLGSGMDVPSKLIQRLDTMCESSNKKRRDTGLRARAAARDVECQYFSDIIAVLTGRRPEPEGVDSLSFDYKSHVSVLERITRAIGTIVVHKREVDHLFHPL